MVLIGWGIEMPEEFRCVVCWAQTGSDIAVRHIHVDPGYHISTLFISSTASPLLFVSPLS